MRGRFRPDQAGREEKSGGQSSAGEARGEEEGRGKSWASQEEGRSQGAATRAKGEAESRGRPGRPREEGGRPEAEGRDWPAGPEGEGGRSAKGRQRPTEEGGRASEDGTRPRAATTEGVEETHLRDPTLVVGARASDAPTPGPSTGNPELLRTPLVRSSQDLTRRPLVDSLLWHKRENPPG